jgi:hypothetical protein
MTDNPVMQFTKATKKRAKLRVLIEGASGSGKTTAALRIASVFGKVAVIDTERGSASLYSDQFNFDVLDLLPPYEPERFVAAIRLAEDAGYDAIVIDSITHEWAGEGGCLDIQAKLGGQFQDWKKVTPRHQKFIDSILGSKCHIVATCRTKTEYSLDKSENGKTKPTKVGMAAQQRDGLDYEMTVVFRINQNHLATAEKDRTRLFDGRDAEITVDTGKSLKGWLESGAEPAPAESGKPSDGELLRQSLKDAFGDHLEAVNAFCVATGKLQAGESILDLDHDRAMKALAAKAAIIRKATEGK